jgi:hypothetical protein
MRQVQTNAELAAFHRAGSGVVFNAYTSGPTAGQSNVLHAAFCASVGRMLTGAIPDARPSVPKIFFETADEARAWLLRYRGEEDRAWRRHACRAGIRPGAGDRDNDPGAASRQADGPFREAEVESLLYSFLRGKGYVVRQKVRVPSGIVDAVGTRGGERIVIEAKGEDSGGYDSTQMNFQMAVGQIASRMGDPDARYAIALPVTADYVRVLRTFRGSPAFERLGIAFYVVDRSGDVREIEPRLVRGWIESLGNQ